MARILWELLECVAKRAFPIRSERGSGWITGLWRGVRAGLLERHQPKASPSRVGRNLTGRDVQQPGENLALTTKSVGGPPVTEPDVRRHFLGKPPVRGAAERESEHDVAIAIVEMLEGTLVACSDSPKQAEIRRVAGL
ncbi:hypothetical protein QDX23_07565 [Auritidibacter ignavus]|nr:hypothetical protein [Auritidibacter ignavus]WGH89995.1 hypothetical protein QDX23_07565 [Auritidibacter ignavus]WHS27045.1 hypothetical protein QM395_06405 [Auritidibacter ignavus]